jgi:phosphoadenosine phosphosulfate reductase
MKTASDVPADPQVFGSRLKLLAERYHGWRTSDLLAAMIVREFPQRIVVVSSFGAEAAVILHLVAGVDAATPVVFLNTGKIFAETLQYRDRLVSHLGLVDVRTIEPDPGRVSTCDPRGDLWSVDGDVCCRVRKVEPLEAALAGFDAWISGRKRFPGGERLHLPIVEAGRGRRVKINPLAAWSKERLENYFAVHDLPRHPLEGEGFRSIGCAPCTHRVAFDAAPRSGRWPGKEKSECGIHLPSHDFRCGAEAGRGVDPLTND